MNYSPLRYPGGKSSLYDFLRKSIELNSLSNGTYVECFAGGAGAALKLLMLEDIYDVILNDKDEFVYKFWNAILNQTDSFIKLLSDTKVSMDEWKYRKEILSNENLKSQVGDLEIAFTAFFLNRCNRSGILHAGAIGGVGQTGNWKLDARYNKENLISRIEKIAYYKDRIKLYNLDAIELLKRIKKSNNLKETFIYLDPPYVEQGDGLYKTKYKREDHIKLSKYLQRSLDNHIWLVSYDDHELINNCYKEVEKNIFEFNYFANKTKVGRELVICSKQFKMPTTYNHYSKNKKVINKEPILEKAKAI
jgi:DNA adenine methylase